MRLPREDIRLLADIVAIVGGTLVISTFLGGLLTSLSETSRQYLVVLGLLILGYGATAGLYRAAKWARTRASPPITGPGLNRYFKSGLISPFASELQSAGRALERMISTSGSEALSNLFSRVSTPEAITSLFETTVRQKAQDTFRRVRALQFETLELDDVAQAAKDLIALAYTYGEFIDQFKKSVTLTSDEHKELLRLCVDSYNHVARHLQAIQPDLELLLAGKFQSMFIGVKTIGM